MYRRDFSLTLALCVSLLAHAAAMLWLLHEQNISYAIDRWMLRQPIQITVEEQLQHDAIKVKPTPVKESPPHPEFTMVPAPPLPPAPAKAAPPKPELYNHADFGDSKGKGDAPNSFQGNKPMQAKKGPQNQAFLSREPAGTKQKPEAQLKPTPPPPPTPAPALAQPGKPQEIPPPEVVAQKKQENPDLLAEGATPATQKGTDEVKPLPPKTFAAATPKTVLSVTPPPPPAIKTAPAQPTPTIGPGDVPAPLADSDSDAFSTTGSIEFHPGKVEARFGRKVKTTRPKLTLAGQYDLLGLGPGASVVLKVRFDSTGKVTKVDILRTSGSTQVDQPCQVAVYDWWFEPTKNAKGEPQGDVIVFSIGFY